MKTVLFKIALLIFSAFFIQCGFSQLLFSQNVNDSLDLVIKNTESDSAKLKLLLDIAEEFKRDSSTAIQYANEAVRLSLEINDSTSLADAWSLIGISYKYHGKYDQSLKFLNKSLVIREKMATDNINIDLLNRYALSLQNIGHVYYHLGIYNEAAEYQFKSIKIYEKTKNIKKIYTGYITLAAVYSAQKNYEESLDAFNDVLKICEKEKDSVHICLVYMNIGAVYGNMKEYEKAVIHFEKALSIAEKINDIKIIGSTLTNIGLIYKNREDYYTALEYYFKSLEFRRKFNNPHKIASSYTNIGYCYSLLGEYTKALNYLNEAFTIAEETNSMSLKLHVLEPLSLTYSEIGNYKKAYEYQKMFKEISDSILNESNTEEITKLKMQHQFNKQFEIQELEKQKAEAISIAEIKFQKDLRNAFVAAFLFMFLLVLFLIRSYFVKQKRNRFLAVQKIEIQEKNEELIVQKNEIEDQKNEINQQKDLLENQNLELQEHRNELEKLVEVRTADLKVAKEKAEEADSLKTAFLANMSHEIRTPMNAIIGFSDIIINHDSKLIDLKELLSNIIISTKDLQHLLNNIIDVAKIESGQIKLYKEFFLLSELMEEIVYDFHDQLPQDRDVKVSFNEKTNIKVHADRLRLRQVLRNIIENSIKYTEKGRIETGYCIESSSIVFHVKDTGIGMSEEKQNEIFKRFTKIENEMEKVYRGAGLGLYICKNLIELMGGKIWLDSKMNVGTNFFFSIPYQNDAKKGKA